MKFKELILNRRSNRSYNNQDIPQENLMQILDAGLLAPSSRNLHPIDLVLVQDPMKLQLLSRAKTAGSGFLKNAKAGIVVLGNHTKSDAWIEDGSVAMTYMQLAAVDLGVSNCWVQCRGRISQQKKGAEFTTECVDIANGQGGREADVAARLAQTNLDEDNLSSDEYVRSIVGAPNQYSVLAILALGMSDKELAPHKLEDLDRKHIHNENFDQ